MPAPPGCSQSGLFHAGGGSVCRVTGSGRRERRRRHGRILPLSPRHRWGWRSSGSGPVSPHLSAASRAGFRMAAMPITYQAVHSAGGEKAAVGLAFRHPHLIRPPSRSFLPDSPLRPARRPAETAPEADRTYTPGCRPAAIHTKRPPASRRFHKM